jgi:hypothetical protein
MTTEAPPERPAPTGWPLPAEPELRPRRYLDGMCHVPLDLVRDPQLGSGDKTVACALSALSFGSTEVIALNETIGRHCGLKSREIQTALKRLEAHGWIRRAAASGKLQRRIVLLWKLPDTFDGLVPLDAPKARRKPGNPQLPLFGGGGDP